MVFRNSVKKPERPADTFFAHPENEDMLHGADALRHRLRTPPVVTTTADIIVLG